MKVLIIYAHPDKDSLNHAILEQVLKGLRQAKHEYTLIDLYQENFNPILVFNQDSRRRDLHENPEMEPYRKLVSEADHLIFIYPIWWYGLPAILKGFIDRVFVSGFAYTYKGALPKGLLKNKSAWVIYTIDSPRWYVSLFRLNAEWIVMKRAVLQFCGIKKVKRIMFAGVKTSSVERRTKWLNRVFRLASTLK